jgi:hypothetical protein
MHPALDSVATLAWLSEQIIVGVVIEQRPPIALPVDPQDPASARIIYTDSLVRVDRQLRGLPLETVLVRRQGGTVGGCVDEQPHVPSLTPGDEVLLFLREYAPPAPAAMVYYTVGGPQGHWRRRPDGTVIPTRTGAYPEASGAQVEEVERQIRAALHLPPPPAAPPYLIVPLDRAPLPASAPPSPATR